MTYLNSSAIDWVDYDPATKTLKIQFHSGDIYTLRGVPEHHYHGLVKAWSAGRYFNENLRGQY